ncbi:hypothetical protein LUW76_33690 [Actinomadura madurae]|uniref:hypothetical protein n=1 Tax=Actinomadura madurae TaxID=1993 RepID=UPI002025FBA6|nr:hypothetical protein [Actinomadura madurae]URM98887.1 hypothetical protein LUW76_33690 [Actinomadura madurae]
MSSKKNFLIGILCSLGMLVSQALGLSFTLDLPHPLQAAMYVPVVGLALYGWHMYASNSFTLDFRTSKQRVAVLIIAAGSLAINYGQPVAAAALGPSVALAFNCAGSLTVPLVTYLKERHWLKVLLTSAIILTVGVMAQPWESSFSVTGVLFALCGFGHMAGLPIALGMLNTPEAKTQEAAEIQDKRTATAMWAGNVPGAACLAVAAGINLGGFAWFPSWFFVGSMAAVLIFVVPIILSNNAAKRLAPSMLGAIGGLAAVVGQMVELATASWHAPNFNVFDAISSLYLLILPLALILVVWQEVKAKGEQATVVP